MYKFLLLLLLFSVENEFALSVPKTINLKENNKDDTFNNEGNRKNNHSLSKSFQKSFYQNERNNSVFSKSNRAFSVLNQREKRKPKSPLFKINAMTEEEIEFQRMENLTGQKVGFNFNKVSIPYQLYLNIIDSNNRSSYS